MASRDQLIFEVKIVPDESGLRNLSSRVSREVGTSSNLKKQIDATADEVRLLTKDLENLSARGQIGAEELEQAYGELQARLDNLDGVTKKTVSAQSTLIGAQNRLGAATGDYSKIQSNANQTLFSFGDIANDAQQFSFGFGQGLRAIGNNIGFTAEQIANTTAKTGSFKNTLKALGGSLLGPGGIILGLNLAVSALTIFSSRAKKTEDDVDKLQETVKDLSDEILNLDDINDLNTIGLLQSASAQNILATRFERYVNLLRSEGFTELADTYEEQAKQLRDQAELTTKRRQELIRIIQVQEGLTEAEIKNRFANIENNETQQERVDLQIEQLELYAKQDGAIGLISGTLDQIVEKQRGQIRLERRNLELKRELGLIDQTQFELESDRLDNRLLAIQTETEERRKAAKEQINVSVEGFEFEDPGLIEDKALQDALKRQDKELLEARKRNLAEYVDAFKQASEQIAQTDQQLAQRRIQLQQNVIGALKSLSQSFAKDNKGLAIAVLAIEKALAISQVVIDGIREANKATAQGFAFLANPATAPLAANAFSQAAAIKGLTAANAAAIAAQGLAEGANIINRGSRSDTGGASSGSQSQSTQGFQTTEASVVPPSRNGDIIVNLSGEFDPRMVSIKAEEGDRRRLSNRTVIRSE